MFISYMIIILLLLLLYYYYYYYYYYYIIIIISLLLLLLLLYALICPSMNKFNSNNILNIKLAQKEFIKGISKRKRKIRRNILWIMFNNR